jgi:hypothetical protein
MGINMEAAELLKDSHPDCYNDAIKISWVLSTGFVFHIFLAFVNFFKESYEGRSSIKAQFLKMVEAISIMIYF